MFYSQSKTVRPGVGWRPQSRVRVGLAGPRQPHPCPLPALTILDAPGLGPGPARVPTPGLTLYTLGTRRLFGFSWILPLGLGKGKSGKPWTRGHWRTVNGKHWGEAPGSWCLAEGGLPGSLMKGKWCQLPVPGPAQTWTMLRGGVGGAFQQVGEDAPPLPVPDSLTAAVLGG